MLTIMTALHGNEPIPVFALKDKNPLIGNVAALIENQRYIQKDLNSCFGNMGDSYEEILARNLLKQIPKDSMVLDFHTFSAESEPFAIVVSEDMIELACYTGVSRVVYMQYNIKHGCSLIDHRKGVSVEVGRHLSPESFAQAQKSYYCFTNNKKAKNVEVFKVVGLLEQKPRVKNFEEEDGYYPILSGENAYNHFGLKGVLV